MALKSLRAVRKAEGHYGAWEGFIEKVSFESEVKERSDA